MRVAGHPLGRSNALISDNILLPACNTCIKLRRRTSTVRSPSRTIIRPTEVALPCPSEPNRVTIDAVSLMLAIVYRSIFALPWQFLKTVRTSRQCPTQASRKRSSRRCACLARRSPHRRPIRARRRGASPSSKAVLHTSARKRSTSCATACGWYRLSCVRALRCSCYARCRRSMSSPPREVIRCWWAISQ